MNSFHDPIRQINYLKQTLSQNKKPLGFFISAGCPLSIKNEGAPLIPDIKGMTESICSKMESDTSKPSKHFKSLMKQFDEDGKTDPNLEEILSHIRALKQVAGKRKVRGFGEEDLLSLDTRICKIIVEISNKCLPNSDTPYHKIAAWITALERDQPIEIFTTNYDLLFEQALEENRAPYFDGFVGSNQTFFDLRAIEEDKLPPRWSRLWKLHGSINWLKNEKGEVFRGIREDDKHSFLIHPSHLKFDESRRMPYLAMIDQLREFLKQSSPALFICGYSFNDDHLNEVLIQGLQGNSTAIIFAFLYEKLDNYPKAIALARNRANLTLLAFDKGMIGTKIGQWIIRSTVDSEGIPKDIIQIKEDLVNIESDENYKNNLSSENCSTNSSNTSPKDIQEDNTKLNMDEEMKLALFKLGDFVKLGEFLQYLIGENETIR